ncbi:MAG TPA: ROK family protein [Verrucomicrobiae bacterium]|nr:ROK family protein [Verrucomicrobiae bacterium]
MKSSSKSRYWLGFDLGGTKMMATVFDREFNIVAYRRKKTKDGRGAKGLLGRIGETIEEALQAAHLNAKQLGAIGFGCPGWLDLDRGVILFAPNLGLHNVSLKKELSREFGCPVVVANDVDAGTYGEYRFGAGQGVRCLLGVFPGTGIGGGLVYEGKLYRGRVGSCMEIGHIHMQPKGRLCGCGRRGCLETVASRLAIAAEAAEAAYRGEAPHLLEQVGTDVAAARSGALAAAIKAGDRAVEAIVRHAAKDLGIAVGSVVNLLAPDMIVLGGGLVEAMPSLYVQGVRATIKKQAMRPYTKSLKVVVAKLGDDAVAIGAAALAAAEITGKNQ